MKKNLSLNATASLLISLILLGSLMFLPTNISYAVGSNMTFTSGEIINFSSNTEMTFWSGITMIFGSMVKMRFVEVANGNGILEPCDWIQIVWPQGYLPEWCSWWEVLGPDGKPLGEFHVDLQDYPYAHVDIVLGPQGGPFPLPPAPVLAVKKIEFIEPCQLYEVHLPSDWYPLPCTWWEILDPETGHATGFEFHVDWTNESCEFHIDEMIPRPYQLPFPSYEVVARQKITTIAPCDWFIILTPEQFDPAPCSWWEIIYMGEPTGLEFHVDESRGGVFHVDEVLPDPLKIPPTYPTVARRKIDVIQPCEWFRVYDLSLIPSPCTWWKIIHPDLGDIEFHVDESYPDGTFHIDIVWPKPIRPTPTYEIVAEKKIDSISQCDWFKVIAPPGWLPRPCTWWRIVWPAQWAGVTFHVDGNDGISEFHIDFVDPLPPLKMPPWNVIAEPIQPTDPRWYTKPPYPDYAPSGMPDFDQKQDQWGPQGIFTWCGPVAVANSLWWLDSEFESLVNPYPVPPPTISDSFPLVPAFGQWDDHSPNNVDPLVRNLAWLMDTDDQQPPFDQHIGTRWQDMVMGINQYLIQHGVAGLFEVHFAEFPHFGWIEEEIEKCQDVVLFLEFWRFTGVEWIPLYDNPSLEYGHFVTCAGVNSTTFKLLISDPYWDAFEAGFPGRSPVPHLPHADPTVHNDAQYVSQDDYSVAPWIEPPPSPYPGIPIYELVGYLQQLRYDPSWHAFIKAAVVTSPEPHDVAVTDVKTSKDGCKPMLTVPDNSFVNVDITVSNKGVFTETFDVTLYANQTAINTTTVNNLLPSTQAIVQFKWNTTGWSKGNYTIWAYAWPVLYEIYTADNTFIDGIIKVAVPGDINGDGTVDIFDAVLLAGAAGSTPSSPNWNPNSDLNGDEIIDVFDAVILAGHAGEHYP